MNLREEMRLAIVAKCEVCAGTKVDAKCHKSQADAVLRCVVKYLRNDCCVHSPLLLCEPCRQKMLMADDIEAMIGKDAPSFCAHGRKEVDAVMGSPECTCYHASGNVLTRESCPVHGQPTAEQAELIHTEDIRSCQEHAARHPVPGCKPAERKGEVV